VTTYYKVLTDKGYAFHGGTGRWPLPKAHQPGAWKQVQGELRPCENGLHVCAKHQLVGWLGPAIFECDVDENEEVIDAGNKMVVRRARLVRRVDTWNERTARLFAADCADRALRRAEKATGERCDARSYAAVRAAREFASDRITAEELATARAAAWDAAWAGARYDAWAAATDAARAAARAAARDAARDAAWDAARDAARDARAGERKWQTKRLFTYIDGKRGAQ